MRDCILKAARTCIVRRYGIFTCTSTGINDNHFHAKFNQPSHMPVKLQFFSSTTGTSQKYQELSQDTEEFLGRVDGFDSKRKTHEITRLIQQWSTFWSSSDQKNDSMRHFNSKEENDDVLLKGARIVDQLANILLDVRESSIRNSTDGDDDNQNRDRTPYLTTLNLALAFWGKCPPSNTVNGEKAEHLLNRMEQLGILSFNGVGKDKVQFKKVMAAYGAAIQAWVVSPDSVGRTGPNNGNINGALKAQSLLEKLESISIEHNIQPQLRIYNSCMHGFAVRGMVDEAEQLLQKLEDRSLSNAELTPDVLTFSSCINAYLKSTKLGNHTNRSAAGRRSGGDSVAQRAEALLDRMVKRYEATGEDQFRPNQTTFGTGASSSSRVFLRVYCDLRAFD
jgi:pentatricopeptide repeat protein